MNKLDQIAKVIDQISNWTGKAVAWLILPMAGVLVWEVFIRYTYRPTLWAVDIATMSYGTHFFIAGALTLYVGKHIRTDFIYGRWSVKTQCIVDAICYLLLFLPGMILFIWMSWEFFFESWGFKEELMTTWRPPAYPYKLVLPLSGFLILLQGISELIKCIRTIVTGVDHRYKQDLAPYEAT